MHIARESLVESSEASSTHEALLPTYETEAALIGAWKAGNNRAGDDIVQSHAAWIRKYIKDHFGFCDEDLYAAGMLGFVEAMDTFQPERGFRLNTFARKPILNEIVTQLTRDRLIRGNDNYCKVIFSARTALRKQLATEPSADEITTYILDKQAIKTVAAHESEKNKPAQLTQNGIAQNLIVIKRVVASLDAPVRAGSDLTLGDVLPDRDAMNPEETLLAREDRQFLVEQGHLLEQVLRDMEQDDDAFIRRKADILRGQLGIGRSTETLKILAARHSISIERTRQITIRAKAQLEEKARASWAERMREERDHTRSLARATLPA